MRYGLFVFVGCWGILSAAFGDMVTLKSGEKLEGKITSETPESVTMQYNVSESITDQRVIERSEIAKIEKPQADEILFDQLKAIKPDPAMSFPAEQYDGMIAALHSFLNRYPASTHAAEVKANADSLTQEKARVEAGDVKYLGGWLKGSAAAERKMQIDAQHVLVAMTEKAANGSAIDALNIFALMEKDYGNTRAYVPAIELARQLVSSLQKEVAQRQRDLKASEADFQKNFELTPVASQPQILAARKREQDQADAIMAAAEKSQVKWKPLIPKSTKSLDALATATTSEATRLAALPVESMRASLDATDKARRAINALDFATAEEALKIATVKWPSSEAAQYWTKQLVKAKAPVPSPTGGPTPTEQGAAPTPAPAGSTGKPSPSISPGKSTEAPTAPSPAQSPSPAASVSPTPAKPKPVRTPAIPAPTPEPEAPFYMTIPGAISIVAGILVLLGAVTIFNRLKAKRGDVE